MYTLELFIRLALSYISNIDILVILTY